MCKFHILGVCTKGDNCRFAHDRLELQALPDLQRTKLCKTLIATGECNNPACRYAHNKEELRPLPSAPLEPSMPHQDHMQPGIEGLMAAASDPSMQNPLHQAAFDTAMQAAILQVGQAAQAHAVEAARLQALAAQLQTGGMPANAVAPFFSAAAAFGGTALDPKAFAQEFGQDASYSAVDGHPAWRPENSDELSSDMPAMAAAPSGTQPGTSTSWATTMSRVLGDEPVQILPETLRSMSSSSLALLGGTTDDDEEPTTPKPGTPQKAGMKPRQRQLSAVVEDGPGRGSEKRSQDTPLSEDAGKAGGSAEAAAGVEPSSPGGAERRSAESAADCAAGPALPEAKSLAAARRVETTGGRAGGEDAALGGDAEEETRRRSMTASLADTLSATGITVKNTFLDFAPREPASTLRAVQTAAGRLDLMGQE